MVSSLLYSAFSAIRTKFFQSSPVKINRLKDLPVTAMLPTLEFLSVKDLTALKIAFGKTPNKFIDQMRVFQRILVDNPAWRKEAASWKTSLDNKIWLLQVYEIYTASNIKLPQIDALNKVPCERSLKLLDVKPVIEDALNKVDKVFDWEPEVGPREVWTKVSDSIALLTKATQLSIGQKNKTLRPFPDIRNNKGLKQLSVAYTTITYPPDVSYQIDLEELSLEYAGLKQAPDIKANSKLTTLLLNENLLTVPPDVRFNPLLKYLMISMNRLQKPPDVSANPLLVWLCLENNQITEPPDVSQNLELEKLNLSCNKLTKAPDVSKNLKLKTLRVEGNPLSKEAIAYLNRLKTERPELTISK